MRSGKLKLATIIEDISYTADDWELFDSAPGVESIAAHLNKQLKECVNEGLSRRDTERVMYELMSRHSYAGACDSEPEHVLRGILNKVYGND